MIRYLLLTFGLLLMNVPITATPTYHRILVDVQLGPKYLVVTELRDMSPNGDDEAAIPIDGRYQMKKCILNVSVYNEQGNFERLDWWNSHVSSDKKQRKCGRKWTEANSSEMCWGLIPDQRKVYFVTYPLVNVMYADDENDVLDFDFLRPQTLVTDSVELRLHLEKKLKPLAESDVDLAKCKASGEISIKDGVIYVRPKGRTTGGLQVHLAFRPGLFPNLPYMHTKESYNIDDDIIQDEVERTFADSISVDELNSPMMMEDTPKTESGGCFLLEYLRSYPKISYTVGIVLIILGGILFRKIKAWTL